MQNIKKWSLLVAVLATASISTVFGYLDYRDEVWKERMLQRCCDKNKIDGWQHGQSVLAVVVGIL